MDVLLGMRMAKSGKHVELSTQIVAFKMYPFVWGVKASWELKIQVVKNCQIHLVLNIHPKVLYSQKLFIYKTREESSRTAAVKVLSLNDLKAN